MKKMFKNKLLINVPFILSQVGAFNIHRAHANPALVPDSQATLEIMQEYGSKAAGFALEKGKEYGTQAVDFSLSKAQELWNEWKKPAPGTLTVMTQSALSPVNAVAEKAKNVSKGINHVATDVKGVANVITTTTKGINEASQAVTESVNELASAVKSVSDATGVSTVVGGAGSVVSGVVGGVGSGIKGAVQVPGKVLNSVGGAAVSAKQATGNGLWTIGSYIVSPFSYLRSALSGKDTSKPEPAQAMVDQKNDNNVTFTESPLVSFGKGVKNIAFLPVNTAGYVGGKVGRLGAGFTGFSDRHSVAAIEKTFKNASTTAALLFMLYLANKKFNLADKASHYYKTGLSHWYGLSNQVNFINRFWGHFNSGETVDINKKQLELSKDEIQSKLRNTLENMVSAEGTKLGSDTINHIFEAVRETIKNGQDAVVASMEVGPGEEPDVVSVNRLHVEKAVNEAIKNVKDRLPFGFDQMLTKFAQAEKMLSVNDNFIQ